MRTTSGAPPGHEAAIELVGDTSGTDYRSGPPKHAISTVKDATETDSQDCVEDQNVGFIATRSTAQDEADMRRMGKDQQLIRRFRFFSVTAFVAIATAAWEIGLFILTPGLVDGGRAGLVWNAVWNWIGFGPVYLSMAEMASMAPIAGAQYHWVR